MPNKLRSLSGKEVIAILEPFGFQVVRMRGSHPNPAAHCKQSNTIGCCPMHSRRPLAPGTLKNIYRQAKAYLSEDDLRHHFYTD